MSATADASTGSTTTSTVLITGMGGNVGQGIARSLRAMGLGGRLRIVGTNTAAVSPGNHLCDAFFVVPFATDETYPELIRELCRREAIGVIIPSTDYETFHLARAVEARPDAFPPLAASPAETCRVFLDKWSTAQVFAKHGVAFAESCLPSQYRGQFDRVIVKPREGRGSRGVVADPPRVADFSDEHVVQRRYEGKELTIGFYVRLDGTFHGHVTFARTLVGGMTTFCEIDKSHDHIVEPLLRNLLAALPIRGACNVQAIVDGAGEIWPFEVNGRLSGTTSIRGQLGFPDACWTVQERLFGQPIAAPQVRGGAAVRIAMDVIYPDKTLAEIRDAATPHFLF
jgi:carbamoyl-phosphate synthase large subunit